MKLNSLDEWVIIKEHHIEGYSKYDLQIRHQKPQGTISRIIQDYSEFEDLILFQCAEKERFSRRESLILLVMDNLTEKEHQKT